ncbi:MAG: two-component system response regulator [Nitrospinaceae bacterium]|nr:MAG: two-component system response regulator [Nitrospinaceae bacterium]
MNIRGMAKKILCIDDDPALAGRVREIINHSFDASEVEVFHSSTGEQGLDRMKQTPMDIVLCNVELQGITGFEICRAIRKSHPQCAVILMSPYQPESDTALKAKEAGAETFLSKPIKQGEFLFAVHSVLRAVQQENAIYEKNQQLEEALGQLKTFHKKVADLNIELQVDKRRLGSNLQEVTELNHQLEEKNLQISSMVDEIGRRFDSTEALLASIIEMHQANHRGHSERVAEISTFIAEKMNLTDYQVRNIKSAARLHELGIVALPSEEKRVEALDEGKSRSRTHHTLVGEMLLKGFPGFELIANIIRHLHENVDGSGFPDKLYGDRIPIGSRIVSLASYFDHCRILNPDSSPASTFAVTDQQRGKFFDENVLNYLDEYVETQMTSDETKTLDCSVFALVEGMELASNIYSESGINILMKGTVLNGDILNKVLKFHAVDPIAGAIKIKQPN